MAKKSPSGTPATDKGLETRRSFLGKLGLGAAALAAVSAIPFLRLGQNASGQNPQSSKALPGEDSIFHPRKDSKS